MDELKSYQFCVKFGEATNTDDATGEIIHTSSKRPCDNTISTILQKYIGLIEQAPPNFSAIKVNGTRAYDLARQGLELKLKPRPLFVKDLKFLEDSVKNYNEHKKHFNKKMVNRLCKRKAIKLIRKHYSV